MFNPAFLHYNSTEKAESWNKIVHSITDMQHLNLRSGMHLCSYIGFNL